MQLDRAIDNIDWLKFPEGVAMPKKEFFPSDVRQQSVEMASVRRRQGSCSVVDCTNQHQCLFFIPSKEEQKRPWLHFIINGYVQLHRLHVCLSVEPLHSSR